MQTPETEDAMSRTRLANERTYLAWWRTGLTSMAVGIGAGKIAPEIAGGTGWPYVTVGAVFTILGIAFVGYGFWRLREVEAALSRGEFAPPDDRFMAVITAAGALLGLLTIALLVFEP
jgi:putative membrane protein